MNSTSCPATWVNQAGDVAGPDDTLVEPVVAERPRKSPPEMAQFLSDAKIEFDDVRSKNRGRCVGSLPASSIGSGRERCTG